MTVTNERAIIQYKGEPITITYNDVKNLICPLATNQEVVLFLKICQSLSLNPFADELYLIKYSLGDKAATVIAIDAYLKASELNAQYDGHEAGIILKDSAGKLELREGAFLLEEEREQLVGGWARVYRKDRSRPFFVAVNKRECLRYRRDGALTEFWTVEKQPSMLRKTALKRSLVEAFPSLFSGTISNVDYELLEGVIPAPKGEMLEGKLPPAYIKEGEQDWPKFWARQKEKGLEEDAVHKMLGVNSLKEEWLAKGRTLEEAEDIINDYLAKKTQEPKKAEAKVVTTAKVEIQDRLSTQEEREVVVKAYKQLKGWPDKLTPEQGQEVKGFFYQITNKVAKWTVADLEKLKAEMLTRQAFEKMQDGKVKNGEDEIDKFIKDL